jgi:hypothetical protein
LGNKGPRVADLMFIITSILQETRKDILTIKLFKEIINMALGIIEIQGHLARAL